MGYDPVSVTAYYVALFAPRVDAYNIWTAKGWRPKREPLTPQIALAALTKRGPSVGAYMISTENASHVLAFDFDTDDGMEQAYTLAQTMRALGMAAFVETSRRGAHLWSPLAQPIPAKTIRRAARSLLETALPQQAKDPHIEIRPGSDEIADGGLGHPLRLPCMPHPKTGKPGIMYSPDRQRLGHTLSEILLAVAETPATPVAVVEQRAAMWRPTVSALPKMYRNTYRPSKDPFEDASASDILREQWDVPNARPGKAVKCPAHDDRNPSLSILPDDKRAICKTPGCILNNNDHGRGTYELTTLAPRAVA